LLGAEARRPPGRARREADGRPADTFLDSIVTIWPG
jgi:hypothetical protein